MSDQQYGYDRAGLGVRLDPADRSKNAPGVLAGYPLEVAPVSDWPGVSAGSGQVRFDINAMTDVATWLEQCAADLSAVPTRLTGGTQGVAFGPPSWLEAAHLGEANRQVSQAVTDYSKALVDNLTTAAGAIRAAAAGNASAEAVSGQASDQLNSQLGSPGSMPGSGGSTPIAY